MERPTVSRTGQTISRSGGGPSGGRGTTRTIPNSSGPIGLSLQKDAGRVKAGGANRVWSRAPPSDGQSGLNPGAATRSFPR